MWGNRPPATEAPRTVGVPEYTRGRLKNGEALV
jgi:hypothetical protein